MGRLQVAGEADGYKQIRYIPRKRTEAPALWKCFDATCFTEAFSMGDINVSDEIQLHWFELVTSVHAPGHVEGGPKRYTVFHAEAPHARTDCANRSVLLG